MSCRCFHNRPATYELKPYVFRDTWDGFTVSFTSSGTAFASVLSSARMFFRDSSGTIQLELTSADGLTLESTASNAWRIRANSRILNLLQGVYQWSLETTDAQGIIKTRLIGTFPIILDSTY